MRYILHILTRPEDALAQSIRTRQQELATNNIVVADLTVPSPDYKVLLDKIFAADSVEIW